MNEKKIVVIQHNIWVELTKLLLAIQVIILAVYLSGINILASWMMLILFAPLIIIVFPFICIILYAIVKTIVLYTKEQHNHLKK